MKKRNIMVITERRAEYGLAKSILEAIENHPKLKLSLVVTGNHLIPGLGSTINQIKRDGFKISSIVDTYPKDDTGAAMAESFGECTHKLVKVVKKIKPDVILVLTDISSTIAGAIVGAYMNIPAAHLHGGEVSGTIDESIRHAVTKFAHIHLPSSKKSADRLIKMGEERWRVHQVGAPGLDYIRQKKFTKPEEIYKKLDLSPNKKIFLLVQHSVTTEVNEVEKQVDETMKAIVHFKEQTVVLYPNADAGGRKIIEVIEKYKKYPFIKIYKNLSHEDYLGLLNVADVMIGNSSSGIVEAPSFKLPVVNIGTRQEGRERASNVIDVDHNREKIKKAIKIALSNEFKEKIAKCKNPYGDGKTGPKVADILAKIKIDKRLLQKQLTY